MTARPKIDKESRSGTFITWCQKWRYVPLNTVYETAKSPLRYVCTCGHERSISWKRMVRGETGCKPCSSSRGAAKRKFTVEQARARFLAKGLKLLTEKYEEANATLLYVCLVCGVSGRMRLSTVNLGHGCKTCANRIKAAARKVSLADVRGYYQASSLELLEVEYSNNSTPMDYRCGVCGYAGSMAFKVVRRGGGCPACAVRNRTGPGHRRWIEDREEARLRKKIIEKCHDSLKHCLMYIDTEKLCKAAEMLGYSPRQLRARLEEFLGWPDLMKGEWHLDHIFPIIAFIEYEITDIAVINSLDNLQPLDAKSNLSKSGSYDRAEFEAHLKSKGVEFTRPIERCRTREAGRRLSVVDDDVINLRQ